MIGVCISPSLEEHSTYRQRPKEPIISWRNRRPRPHHVEHTCLLQETGNVQHKRASRGKNAGMRVRGVRSDKRTKRASTRTDQFDRRRSLGKSACIRSCTADRWQLSDTATPMLCRCPCVDRDIFLRTLNRIPGRRHRYRQKKRSPTISRCRPAASPDSSTNLDRSPQESRPAFRCPSRCRHAARRCARCDGHAHNIRSGDD